MIDNIPRIFTTQAPHQNCSRYYVYVNGLIRVKLAGRSVSIAPGKNIVFVDDWGHEGNQVVFRPTHLELFGHVFDYAEMLDPNSGNQYAGIGRRPLDFYLADTGFLAPHDRHHRGHAIVEDFTARIGGRDVDPEKLDTYIQRKFGYTGAGQLTAPAKKAAMSNKMVRTITA